MRRPIGETIAQLMHEHPEPRDRGPGAAVRGTGRSTRACSRNAGCRSAAASRSAASRSRSSRRRQRLRM